jgi:excinuclease ABC subunit C
MTDFAFDPQRYPTGPGCYLMRDAAGRVLYVGKAANLRRRLSSYFRARVGGTRVGRTRRARKDLRLVARVREVEVILAGNDVEGRLLENNLIKRYKPPFNVAQVGDDTGFFFIALTAGELPRLVPYRELRMNVELGQDAVARTFGPYVSRRFRDTLLEYLCETFGVRTCDRLPTGKQARRACLRYHLGYCCGVCRPYAAGLKSSDAQAAVADYARIIEQATDFLTRPHDDLIERMKTRMLDCAARQQYERAARVRDQVRALEFAFQPQVVERAVDHDEDAIYVGREAALIAHVRRGKVLRLSLHDLGEGEDAAAFLLAHYARHYAPHYAPGRSPSRRCPPVLIVNRLAGGSEGRAAVADTLSQTHGTPVEVIVPKEGFGRALLAFCERNYAYRVEGIVDGRQSAPPRRIT